MRFDRMRCILRLEICRVKRYRLNRVRCISMYPERWGGVSPSRVTAFPRRGAAGNRPAESARSSRRLHDVTAGHQTGQEKMRVALLKRETFAQHAQYRLGKLAFVDEPAPRDHTRHEEAAAFAAGAGPRRSERRAASARNRRVQPRLPCSVGICSNRLESQSTKSLSLAGTWRFGGYSTEIGRAGVLKPVRTSRNSPDFR